LFALANTGILLGGGWAAGLGTSNSLGIFLGLIIGKPLGIFLFSFLGASLGLCALPPDIQWKQIVGAGFLGGIGFTMSIFITLLAFDQAAVIDSTKISILIASAIAGIIGFLWLKATLKTSLPQAHRV